MAINKLNRREFLKIGGLAFVGGLAATTTYLAINDESNQLSIEHIFIPIVNLPAGLEGFTITQLSDIHLYPYTQPDLIRRAVKTSNSLQPDVTVLTGDFVWRSLDAIHLLTPILAGLNARYGVYGILGNHDYWLNAQVIKSAFDEVRLPLLVNKGVTISQGNGSLYLAGLDDGWSGNPDIIKTLQGAPTNAPVILLLHEPDLADYYSRNKRISLQLSGHSHGGQVRIRGFGPIILPHLGRKYDFGLYKVNDMWLYTNRGIGNISVPVRYNCPPEITEFTLVQA